MCSSHTNKLIIKLCLVACVTTSTKRTKTMSHATAEVTGGGSVQPLSATSVCSPQVKRSPAASSNNVNEEILAMGKELVVLVDHRELNCSTICDTLRAEKIPTQISTLKVGDYGFFLRDAEGKPESPEEGDFVCLVERKAATDMYASIKDGRYKHQHENLLRHPAAFVCYVLVGDPKYFTAIKEQGQKAVVSALLHISCSALEHAYEDKCVQTHFCPREVLIPHYLSRLHRYLKVRAVLVPVGVLARAPQSSFQAARTRSLHKEQGPGTRTSCATWPRTHGNRR